MRILMALASFLAVLALVVAPVLAQTQAPAPPGSPARPAPGAGVGAGAAVPDKAKEVEGTVKKVDPATKSVQVSAGVLGLFGATLEVTDETKINVEGKTGSLTDLREGAKVKASYESRDGKNVAKSIDVIPGDEKVSAPARPATPGATPPSAAQPGGPPKTQ